MTKKTENVNQAPVLAYLCDQLGRSTNGKPTETFVLNALWQRLYFKLLANDDEPEMQALADSEVMLPIAQYMVPRQKKERALIDLYFPYIKVGIECNEAYHQKGDQPEQDAERLEEITAYIDRDETNDSQILYQWLFDDFYDELKRLDFKYKVFTINAATTLDGLYSSIDEAVNEIVERTKKLIESKGWLDKVTNHSSLMKNDLRSEKIQQRFLLPETTPGFRTIVDARRFFLKDAKETRQIAWFKLDDNDKKLNQYYLWMPDLYSEPLFAGTTNKVGESFKSEDALKCALNEKLRECCLEKKESKWSNFVAKYKDNVVLIEVQLKDRTEKDASQWTKTDKTRKKEEKHLYRITFGKYQDRYRYAGVFEYLRDFDLSAPEVPVKGSESKVKLHAFVYKRIARKLIWELTQDKEVDLTSLAYETNDGEVKGRASEKQAGLK